MSDQGQKKAGVDAAAVMCLPRRNLAITFAVLAAVCVLGGFKVLLDLIDREAIDAAIMGFVGLLALATGFVFAARACTGLRADQTGVASLSVIGGETAYRWEQVAALVYCIPRSPDAAEAFWFEIEGGRKCGIPLRCGHDAARYALARGLKLKIIRYFQLATTDLLEGEAHTQAEEFLKRRLEKGKAPEAPSPQPEAGSD